MKKLVLAFIGIALVVGCAKSDNNNGSANTVAVTPTDCINQGLQPAIYPNNWNNPYYQTYYTWGYGPSYSPYVANNGGPFSQNNVGCIYNGNNFQQVNWNGQPYYYVPDQICNLNSPYNNCPAGLRCVRPQGYYIYWGLGLMRQGVCAL